MSDEKKPEEVEADPKAPDLSDIPNFGALRKWIDKLEMWCTRATEEIESLEQEVGELRDEVEEKDKDLERQADEASEALRDLVLYMEDVERGIRTPEELRSFMEKNNYSSYTKGAVA